MTCPCAGGVVVFSYTAWSAMFPELASSVSASQAQGYFTAAEQVCDNTPTSLIQDLTTRAMLLNWATAHVAALFGTINGNPASPLVGRITNATEGSVSVAVEMPNQAPGAAWWMQTRYGAFWWQMTTCYRQGRYYPAPVTGLNGILSNGAGGIPGQLYPYIYPSGRA